jgi:hypothetical protein
MGLVNAFVNECKKTIAVWREMEFARLLALAANLPENDLEELANKAEKMAEENEERKRRKAERKTKKKR